MPRLAMLSAVGSIALLSGCAATDARHAKAPAAQTCPAPAASAHVLRPVRTATLPVPGPPFSVVASHSGSWSFVSLPNAVLVIATRGFAPQVVRQIALPTDVAGGQHQLALTLDGRFLLVATANGALVFDVLRAERGGNALLGRLTSPVRALPGIAAQAGPGAVAASRDGRYVFVARGRAGGVAVFDLEAALASGFGNSGLVGVIPVGLGPVGLIVSPSGRRLYVTSVAAVPAPGIGGTLTVIDTALAVRIPWRSVLRTVAAGCEPVAVTSSPNGRIVWVTTLADHAVLGFDSARLVREPGRALIALVRVGETPTGLVAYADGRRLLVADAARINGAGSRSSISVIDTARALAGRPALVGSIAVGVYPRQLALLHGRATALLTNYGSAQIEAIDLSTIP